MHMYIYMCLHMCMCGHMRERAAYMCTGMYTRVCMLTHVSENMQKRQTRKNTDI
jgi:hypothetical protein